MQSDEDSDDNDDATRQCEDVGEDSPDAEPARPKKRLKPEPKEKEIYRISNVRCSLKAIVTDTNVIERIERVVRNAHLIRVRTERLLGLYLFQACDTTAAEFPTIKKTQKEAGKAAKSLYKHAANVLTGNAKYEGDVRQVYLNLMVPALQSAGDTRTISLLNMSQHLKNESVRWVTNLTTNLQEHFEKHLFKWIAGAYGIQPRETHFDDHEYKHLKLEVKKLTGDVMHGNLENLPDDVRDRLVGYLPPINKNIAYTLVANPLSLVRAAMLMQRDVVACGMKALAVLPESESNIPGYMQFDTELAIKLLLTEADFLALGKNQTQLRSGKGSIEANKALVWGRLLRTHRRVFCPRGQRGLKFGGSISTDGHGCSIQLYTQGHINRRNGSQTVEADLIESIPDKYIDDPSKRESLRGKKIVAIDPNMRDLIFGAALGKETPNIHHVRNKNCLDTWRYTSMQRRFESGEKQFRIAREHMASEVFGEDGMTANKINTALPPRFCSTIEALVHRITACTRAEVRLEALYLRDAWRDMRMRGKFKMQSSEALMVNSFKAKFGTPDKVIIAFGDGSKGNHMRYNAPAKRKGFRKVFRRAGFEVLLLDECRTSKSCFRCATTNEHDCEPFRWWAKSPKPWKNRDENRQPRNQPTRCHGLIACPCCLTRWNRDVLATANMLEIAYCAAAGEDRPERFARRISPP